MQSISGYIGSLFNGRQKPRAGGGSITSGTQTEAWTKRPLMDSNKFYADKNKRAAKPKTNSDWDPRDNAKYGVTATRPYSTKSKHGTGRGSQA